MVEIFSNFVFFVMRTPYELRIYSLFAKFRQKIFRSPQAQGSPLGVSFFRLLRFFLILCFLWWGPHMNSEYIVCLQNFDKIFFLPPQPQGSPPWGVIFSIGKIFSNFVFFVMRTQYLHRISCFFIHLKKIRPAFEK